MNPEAPRTSGYPTSGFAAFYQAEFSNIALLAGATAGDRSSGQDIAQVAFGRAEPAHD